MGVGQEESIHLCKLVEIDGEMMVKGYSTQANGTWHWIRSKDGVRYMVTMQGVPDFYVSEGLRAHIVNDHNGLASLICVDGRFYGIEEGRFKLASSRCADFRGGVFAAALSDSTGREHCLFLGGKLVPLEFNGYFTSLKIID